MTDRYDNLRVPPDPSRAEELRQLLHAELERSPLEDATASRRRLTIAPSTGGAEFEPMEEMHMTDNSADEEHKTRWRIPAVAAAAIVVLGVGAIAFAVTNTNADDPDGVSQTPAPTPTTTAAPTTTIAPRIVTYTGIPGVPVTYTLPDGWDAPEEDEGFVAFGESSIVNFWDVANVYADGCEDLLLEPPLGPTVDDLATVWSGLAGFTATTPVDVTVDGYAGKQVDFTVPDYPTVVDSNGEDRADCVNLKFAIWDERDGDGSPNYWAQAPAQQHRLWIIDVNGTRLVIAERSALGSTPEKLADMDEFLASIQIG